MKIIIKGNFIILFGFKFIYPSIIFSIAFKTFKFVKSGFDITKKNSSSKICFVSVNKLSTTKLSKFAFFIFSIFKLILILTSKLLGYKTLFLEISLFKKFFK